MFFSRNAHKIAKLIRTLPKDQQVAAIEMIEKMVHEGVDFTKPETDEWEEIFGEGDLETYYSEQLHAWFGIS